MHQNTTPHTPHALHVCGDEASMFCSAHISQGLGLSLGRVSCVSSPSGFFSQTFACFRAHAVRGLWCNQLDDLLPILRILSHITLLSRELVGPIAHSAVGCAPWYRHAFS